MAMAAAAALALGGCRSKSREERLQQAEEAARFKAEEKARMAKGVGQGLQGAGREGAQALSKGVGAVYRGTVKGLDQGLTTVAVTLAPSLASSGMRIERAGRRGTPEGGGVTLYLVHEGAFAGTLLLRALDEGREVGRARATVKKAAGDAGYVDFVFDERVPVGALSTFELGVVH
ncbi:MAG TPA: hypothetical protein VFO85_18390 [Vicinamibacteria bacterium]|nr:hypothetical protein [Vicinamibacteria bacterium]